MTQGDDASIPGDEELFRRIPHSSPDLVVTDVITGARRPSSGAFKPDEDGLSVYRATLLEAGDLSAIDVALRPGNLVVGLLVSEVRALALGVRDDPWPPGLPEDQAGHPRNAAHALIVGWEGRGRGARRQKQKALSQAPSLRFIDT